MQLTLEQQQWLQKKQCIIFTDLDGTLLGHDAYDLGQVPEFLQHLKELNVPVIFNTSKTWAEVQELQKALDYFNPCIVENGGGIHVPAESQWQPAGLVDQQIRFQAGKDALSIRDELNRVLDGLSADFKFERMRDWDTETVVRHTGLSFDNARLANNRLYSEPLLWQDSDTSLVHFSQSITDKGLRLVRGGRFCHVMKQQDKSIAMQKVVEAFVSDFGFKPLTIALGDNHNDKQMLENADIACVLTLPGRSRIEIQNKNIFCPQLPAPQGWTESISFLFNL